MECTLGEFEQLSDNRLTLEELPASGNFKLLSRNPKPRMHKRVVFWMLAGATVGGMVGGFLLVLTGQLLYLSIAGIGCGLGLVFSSEPTKIDQYILTL